MNNKINIVIDISYLNIHMIQTILFLILSQ